MCYFVFFDGSGNEYFFSFGVCVGGLSFYQMGEMVVFSFDFVFFGDVSFGKSDGFVVFGGECEGVALEEVRVDDVSGTLEKVWVGFFLKIAMIVVECGFSESVSGLVYVVWEEVDAVDTTECNDSPKFKISLGFFVFLGDVVEFFV